MYSPNDNFNYFLYWCCERMNIFWKKYIGLPRSQWTQDDILAEYRFTNVYRCLDRVSQYLLSHVIYNGKQYEPEDVFFRVLVFKHFNSIPTWERLEKELGDITYQVGFDRLASVLDKIVAEGSTIYNNAYIVNCCFYQLPKYARFAGMSKHRVHFAIFEEEIFQNGHIYDFLEAKTFAELYKVFRDMDIYGDFLAQQYVIDFGYTPLYSFTENEFVVTGPGSLKGIGWCFDGAKGKRYDFAGAIKWTQENFEDRMQAFCKESGMVWRPLPWEPVPTLTNLQNCYCEVSKFAKGLGATFNAKRKERIKRTYSESVNKIDYVFPPKWGATMPTVKEVEKFLK